MMNGKLFIKKLLKKYGYVNFLEYFEYKQNANYGKYLSDPKSFDVSGIINEAIHKMQTKGLKPEVGTQSCQIRTLFLPEGEYYIDTPVKMKPGVSLKGVGLGTIIRPGTTDNKLVDFKKNQDFLLEFEKSTYIYITIEGLRFEVPVPVTEEGKKKEYRVPIAAIGTRPSNYDLLKKRKLKGKIKVPDYLSIPIKDVSENRAQLRHVTFRDLYIFSSYGIILPIGVGECVFEDITAYVRVNTPHTSTILLFRGNTNQVRNIKNNGPTTCDVMSETENTNNAMIMVQGIDEKNPSSQISISNIVFDNDTGTNKTGISFERIKQASLKDYWWEPKEELKKDGKVRQTFPVMLKADRVEYLHISGRFQVNVNKAGRPMGRLVINRSPITYIDHVAIGYAGPVRFLIHVDDKSKLRIGSIISDWGLSYPFESIRDGRIIVDNDFRKKVNEGKENERSDYCLRSGLLPHNFLVNPSFEVGGYMWRIKKDSIKDTIAKETNIKFTILSSEVASGRMAQITVSAGTFYSVYQVVDLTKFVGKVMSFTIMVKVTTKGKTGYDYGIYPFLVPDHKDYNYELPIYKKNKDLDMESRVNRIHVSKDVNSVWYCLQSTFKVRKVTKVTNETVKYRIGVWHKRKGGEVTKLCLDEASLLLGSEAQNSPSSFESIVLGGKTMVCADSSPTDGTWKKGDIVWNNGKIKDATRKKIVIGWIVSSITGGIPEWNPIELDVHA